MDKTREDYKRAARVLNSMQDTLFFGHLTERSTKKIDMMLNCLERVEIKLEDIDRLKIIHVTGTKGKGSTCAYVDSILRQYQTKADGLTAPKFTTGIYSSPHLIEARERIRVNGKPVAMEIFTEALWYIFEKLQATKAKNQKLMPGYFGITLLMAFRIFLQLNVDVVIIEVGIGGEYDASNIIRRPVACALSSIHLEHVDTLGHTVENIAWHKAGIMKKGAPFITTQHQESVMAVIRARAREQNKMCPLMIAPELGSEELAKLGGPLGIAGNRQPVNAALAVQLCRVFLQNEDGLADVGSTDQTEETIQWKEFSNEEKQGLLNARLPGRNQVVKAKGVTYYLDGAHTTDSMLQCVHWFQTEADKEKELLGVNVKRSFVFRMKPTKSVTNHFPFLKNCNVEFERAAFCPHVISKRRWDDYPDSMDITTGLNEAREIADSQMRDWENLKTNTTAKCFPSIVSALWWAGLGQDDSLKDMAQEDLVTDEQQDKREEGDVKHVQVLVTGSLVMVGGALTLLKPDLWD